MKSLLVSVALLAAAVPASANYVLDPTSGYYLNAGNYYARSWVDGYYFYQYGCRYWQPGYYSYSQVAYVPRPAYTGKLDKTEALKAFVKLAELKQTEDYNFADERESEKFMLAISNHLGNGRPNGTFPYGQYGGYAALYHSASIGGYPVSPGTQYGSLIQSYKREISVSGDPAIDLNAMVQGEQQSLQNADGFADKRSARTSDIVKLVAGYEEARRQARVDNELKITAIKAIANGTPTVNVTTQTNTVTPVTLSPAPSPAPARTMPKIIDQAPAANDPWMAYVVANCLKCHSSNQGNKVSGALDFELWDKLAPADKTSWLFKSARRMMLPATDPKHMPQGGPAATPEQVDLFAPR